ncbi:hypothetical protein DN069_08930 [Streptacidiphilus pinicola]|uniref:Uncharacterized protein n=1 Tax=Streptacidiphilus pinicola TaxID=2219663 RepID=A0A2X0IR26_9ACTN|nr:hypothetical protein [Streptacidiphilus pinicola]RAG86013.1 hypothetical protein DN069_08930 [Streptacidiphilus pinicola]
MASEEYCESPDVAALPPQERWQAAPGDAVAACTQCDEPTRFRADAPGAVLCPRCEWQQAQRGACSG